MDNYLRQPEMEAFYKLLHAHESGSSCSFDRKIFKKFQKEVIMNPSNKPQNEGIDNRIDYLVHGKEKQRANNLVHYLRNTFCHLTVKYIEEDKLYIEATITEKKKKRKVKTPALYGRISIESFHNLVDCIIINLKKKQ